MATLPGCGLGEPSGEHKVVILLGCEQDMLLIIYPQTIVMFKSYNQSWIPLGIPSLHSGIIGAGKREDLTACELQVYNVLLFTVVVTIRFRLYF